MLRITIGLAIALVLVPLNDPGNDLFGATSQWVVLDPNDANVPDANVPDKVGGRHMIAVGDYWYAMKGHYANQGYLDTFYCQFQPDGSTGAWLATSDRSVDRFNYEVVSYGDYIYLIGGQSYQPPPHENKSEVEYASINPDGSLSAWQFTTPLPVPEARATFGLVAYQGYMYVVGGVIGESGGAWAPKSVVYAEIDPNDGSLGAWQNANPTQERHPYCVAVAYDGFLYVFGGSLHSFVTARVERAQIDPNDGSLGPWKDDTPLPQDRADMGVACFDDRVYLLGGVQGAYGSTKLSSVIWTTIHLDPNDRADPNDPNHLSPWQDAESLNEPRRVHADTWQGYIYAVGSWLPAEPVERAMETHVLTLTVKHPEWGQVIVEPNLPYYYPNDTVTLTAQPDQGAAWRGWRGDVPEGQEFYNPLTITMDSPKEISTTFCGWGGGSMLPLTVLGLLGMGYLRRRR